ncbi:MAG: prolyl oligopeptidase family serine peptidase [Chloroflexi bacterium]|nr:prolyl oligopeptidase family serine peptidase [Chloroflexota bacterium]
MTILKPGIHEQILSSRGQRYTLAIPDGYTGDAVPLIIVLHWGGVVTPFFGKSILTYLVEPALRELGAIMVAPDCVHRDWTNPQSESQVIALLEYLQEHYNIDADRTIITGYSKGGMGTWYLAARNQDKFAAAVLMAGYPQPDSADVEWEIPLYIVHSRRDEVVPFEPTERLVAQLKDKGVAVEFVVLKDVTHYETGRFVQPLRAAVPWIKKVWSEMI